MRMSVASSPTPRRRGTQWEGMPFPLPHSVEQLFSGMDVELAVDVAHMCPHRVVGDAQLLGDALAPVALHEVGQDLISRGDSSCSAAALSAIAW